MTGAACARLVVKMPAAEALPSAARTVRSRAPAVGFDAAVQRRRTETLRRRDAAGRGSDSEVAHGGRRRQAWSAVSGTHVCRARTRGRITAYCPQLPEQRAGSAVGVDLLRQPGVRHDREPHLDEIARDVRERAQRLEAADAAAREASSSTRRRPMPRERTSSAHDERTHFSHMTAEWRQIGARHHSPALHGHEKARAHARRFHHAGVEADGHPPRCVSISA